jgi:hypothetical protein
MSYFFKNWFKLSMKSTSEYVVIKQLLIDKQFLQCRLRQVDKRLRELELLRPGLSKLIRPEIEEFQCDILQCAGRTNADSACPAPLKGPVGA